LLDPFAFDGAAWLPLIPAEDQVAGLDLLDRFEAVCGTNRRSSWETGWHRALTRRLCGRPRSTPPELPHDVRDSCAREYPGPVFSDDLTRQLSLLVGAQGAPLHDELVQLRKRRLRRGVPVALQEG